MHKFKIGRLPARPADDVIATLRRCGVSTLGHITDFGFPRGLQPLVPCAPFAGPALTIKIPHLDSTAVHEAMRLVQPGDVVVIDQSGDDHRSSFGGTLAGIAADAGAVAAVSNGRTNDVGEILDLGFPVYSRGATPLTTRILGLQGEINTPVCIGGVVVMPGDVIFGDQDGLAVIPAEDAAEVARELFELEEEIARMQLRETVRAGRPLGSLTGAADAMSGIAAHG